jgi:hypothetical protein
LVTGVMTKASGTGMWNVVMLKLPGDWDVVFEMKVL